MLTQKSWLHMKWASPPRPRQLRGKRHQKPCSVEKTREDCRNEWRLSSCAIQCHLMFIQRLGHQPTGAWQPHKPGAWAGPPVLSWRGQVPRGWPLFSSSPSCRLRLWPIVVRLSDTPPPPPPKRSRKLYFYGKYSFRKPLA